MLLDFTALKAWGIIIWNGNTFFNQIFNQIFNLNGQEVPRVSPAVSVGASTFGRGVHRTPAPSKAGG